MASKRREVEEEEVESVEEERRKSWERKVVDGAQAGSVGVFLRGAPAELVSYSKPMPFDKVLEELSVIRDCKGGVIFKRGSNRSMAGEVVLPYGEYDFLPSSLNLCETVARCLPMEGSTSSPPSSSNVSGLEKAPQCGPQPWNRGVYPFVGNMPMLPMLGWGRGPSMPPFHQATPPKFSLEHQPSLPKFTVESQTKPPEQHQVTPPKQMVEHQPKVDEGVQAQFLRNEGSPMLPKYEPRQTRKRKQHINFEDLTQEQVKQGGHWKEHWIVQLIRIRGELANVFAAPPKQGVDNWGRLHRALMTSCPDFNKDSEACRKKWAAIYKDYKQDKAVNSTSGSKCKWFLLVDQYFFDRVNVAAQDDSGHESEETALPVASEVTLEVSPKSGTDVFLERSA